MLVLTGLGQEQNGFAMNLWRPLRFLIFFSLFCYLVSKIVDGINKLEEGELGISVERKSQELVEGRSAIFVTII